MIAAPFPDDLLSQCESAVSYNCRRWMHTRLRERRSSTAGKPVPAVLEYKSVLER